MNFNLTSFLLANLLLAVSYISYYFLLRNLKAPLVNRFVLLGGILLSIITPFIDFSLFSVASDEVAQVLPRVLLDQNVVLVQVDKTINYWKWIELIALVFSGIVFLRLVLGYLKIYFLIKKSTFEWLDGIYLSIQEKLPTFSFFNYIFLNSNHKTNHDVINHELIHAKQKHSIDVLIVECCKVLFWYNPFIHLYKRSIIENHEFIADEVVTNETDKKEYMELILHQAFQASPALAHPFINPKLLKRRIMMINKTKNKRKIAINLSIALVVALLVVTVVSCNKKEEATIPYSLYEEAGQKAFYKYIAENTNYPASEKKKGVEGKVFVQFVINERGKIENPTVAKGVSPLLDEEALRVVNSFKGTFKPTEKEGKAVREQFTLPIAFRLTSEEVVSLLGLDDVIDLKDSTMYFVDEKGDRFKIEVPEKIELNETRDKLIYYIDGEETIIDVKTIVDGYPKEELPVFYDDNGKLKFTIDGEELEVDLSNRSENYRVFEQEVDGKKYKAESRLPETPQWVNDAAADLIRDYESGKLSQFIQPENDKNKTTLIYKVNFNTYDTTIFYNDPVGMNIEELMEEKNGELYINNKKVDLQKDESVFVN